METFTPDPQWQELVDKFGTDSDASSSWSHQADLTSKEHPEESQVVRLDEPERGAIQDLYSLGRAQNTAEDSEEEEFESEIEEDEDDFDDSGSLTSHSSLILRDQESQPCGGEGWPLIGTTFECRTKKCKPLLIVLLI